MRTSQTVDMTTNGSDPEEAAESGAYNLSGLAYRAVSDMIRTRRLRGGETIVEAKLAETLGISRTPLREALQRLEGEGLVVKSASRSYMVRHVDLAEYLQSLRVREILEGEAAALASGKIAVAEIEEARREIEHLMAATAYHTDAHWKSDDRVHGLLMDACGNPVMAQMIRELRVTTRLFEIARLAARLEPDSMEHLEILDSLQGNDPKRARRAAQAHIRSLYRFALDNIS
jgi:DNA-binding GntR family transcriptional regulator